jgi:hypothetical protein
MHEPLVGVSLLATCATVYLLIRVGRALYLSQKHTQDPSFETEAFSRLEWAATFGDLRNEWFAKDSVDIDYELLDLPRYLPRKNSRGEENVARAAKP